MKRAIESALAWITAGLALGWIRALEDRVNPPTSHSPGTLREDTP